MILGTMSHAAEEALERARNGLRYYVRSAWQAAGLAWTADNQAEVDCIVDDIFEAAVDQAEYDRDDS
jgi:hypothetical protein